MIFAIVPCVIIVMFLGISYFVYRVAFYSPHARQNDDYHTPQGPQYLVYADQTVDMLNKTRAIPYEEAEIVSHDGLRLFARVYPGKPGAPVAILAHGYRGTAMRDFCGGLRSVLDLGFQAIAIDERSCGKSGGHTITMGVKEQLDLIGWIDFSQKRFGMETPIVLYGISMGATTTLLACGHALPTSIKGVVADCPYDVPIDIIRSVCKSMHLPYPLLSPFIHCAAWLYGGFSLLSTSVHASVSNARIPILLMHGEDDRYVPCEMSKAIAEANPLVERHTFPQAGHGLSYMVDHERYMMLMTGFLSRIKVLPAMQENN